MSGLILPGSVGRERAAKPTVPAEIADAVEKWARKYGRHAKIDHVMATDPPTPQVRLSPMYGDPNLKLVQEGKIPEEEAWETVEIWEHDPEKGCYVGIPLAQLGPSGVIRHLERTNTWSGSGEYESLEEAVEDQREKRREAGEKIRREVVEDTRRIAGEVARYRAGVPTVQGENFENEETP